MEEFNIEEQIGIIRRMIDRTKRSGGEVGGFFLGWGLILILAIAGNYALVFSGKYDWIWLNWLALPVLAGSLFSFIYWSRRRGITGHTTYVSQSAGYLGLGCGVTFIILGVVFPLLKVYGWEEIPLLMSVVWGTYLFVLGGMLEWKYMIYAGVFAWLVAGAGIVINPEFRVLLDLPVILSGLVIPGMILKKRYAAGRTES